MLEKELITKESLTKAYPQIMTEVIAEAFKMGHVEGLEKGKKEGFASGSEAERSRIMGLQELSLPGHERIIKEAIADGKSMKEDAALRIVAAEKVILGTKLNLLKEDAADTAIVGAAVIDDVEPKAAKKTFEAEVARVEKEEKLSHGKAVQKVARENPELHDEWVAKQKPVKAE